jgi:hypothetical protein
MARHAGQAGRKPGRAGDRAHTPNREIEALQHRPLLDMQFDIGQQFAARSCRGADMVGVEAEFGERIAHRYPGAIF